jgi:hypothetical protein
MRFILLLLPFYHKTDDEKMLEPNLIEIQSFMFPFVEACFMNYIPLFL